MIKGRREVTPRYPPTLPYSSGLVDPHRIVLTPGNILLSVLLPLFSI